MPGIFLRQAVFISNHLHLTTDLQANANHPSFLEETVKSGTFFNNPLPSGGIFSPIAAGILFKNVPKRAQNVFFAQKSPCQTSEIMV